MSDSNFELLETQLKSQVEKSVMELNEEVNLILKKNKLDANSILDDLFRETVKDITTTQNIVKSCISKIDFFAKEGTSEEVINQLKEQSLEQIEKNGISKDSLKNIEELVNPHLKEGRSFQLMIKDAINEQAIPVFKQKLFTSLDKSFNKMLKNESNEKVAQNASMLDIIKEFFASILESISSLFKDKELNAANTLTNAIKSTVDEARINQIQDKDKTNVEKFTQSRNEESAAIHR